MSRPALQKARARPAPRHYSVCTVRVLASLIAVCLVAAAGVRPAAAAPERPWAAEVSRAVATLHARVLDTVPPGRTDSSQSSQLWRAVVAAASHASRPGSSSAPRAAGAPDLLAILVGAPVAPSPPLPSVADPVIAGSLALPVRWLSTHTARGPPVV